MKAKRFPVGHSLCTESSEVDSSEKKGRGRPRKRRFRATEFPLKAKGEEGGPKRTPLHIGDPFAHHDAYFVEEVLAHCQKHGSDHYKVSLATEWALFHKSYLNSSCYGCTVLL